MRKGVYQGSRDQHDRVQVQDLINNWIVSEEEHEIIVKMEMQLVTTKTGWGIQITAKGYKAALEESTKPLYVERVRWPTFSAATFLGLLWALLMRIDDQAAAQDLLAGLGNPPAR